jgi:hypothetical protein
MTDVATGKADFGVCSTGVLLQKPDQPKVIVLGVIFQQCAAQPFRPISAEGCARRRGPIAHLIHVNCWLPQSGETWTTAPAANRRRGVSVGQANAPGPSVQPWIRSLKRC